MFSETELKGNLPLTKFSVSSCSAKDQLIIYNRYLDKHLFRILINSNQIRGPLYLLTENDETQLVLLHLSTTPSSSTNILSIRHASFSETSLSFSFIVNIYSLKDETGKTDDEKEDESEQWETFTLVNERIEFDTAFATENLFTNAFQDSLYFLENPVVATGATTSCFFFRDHIFTIDFSVSSSSSSSTSPSIYNLKRQYIEDIPSSELKMTKLLLNDNGTLLVALNTDHDLFIFTRNPRFHIFSHPHQTVSNLFRDGYLQNPAKSSSRKDGEEGLYETDDDGSPVIPPDPFSELLHVLNLPFTWFIEEAYQYYKILLVESPAHSSVSTRSKLLLHFRLNYLFPLLTLGETLPYHALDHIHTNIILKDKVDKHHYIEKSASYPPFPNYISRLEAFWKKYYPALETETSIELGIVEALKQQWMNGEGVLWDRRKTSWRLEKTVRRWILEFEFDLKHQIEHQAITLVNDEILGKRG